MSTTLTGEIVAPGYLVSIQGDRSDSVNAATAYLRSRRSRRTQDTAASILNTIAYLLGETSYVALDWSQLTADHVTSIIRFMSSTRSDIESYPSLTRLMNRYFNYAESHQSGRRSKRWRNPDDPTDIRWEPFSQSTCNLYLSFLKGVSRQAFLLDQISEREYLRIRDITSFKTEQNDQRPARLTPQDVVDAIDERSKAGTNAGIRDAAILSLLYGAGLRRSELRFLKLENIEWDNDQIAFWGKGMKKRQVPLLPRVKAKLRAWYEVRVSANSAQGAVFVGVDRYDRLLIRLDNNHDVKPMGANVAYELIKRCFYIAPDDPKFGPHELRAVFGTALLDNDVPINTVAELMGHANINTTRIYDRAKEKRKRKGISKLPI